MLRFFALAILASGLIGGSCTMDQPDPNDALPAPTVEIGFTDDVTGVYTPIADGGEIPLFSGLQGGRHIFVTFRATGFEAVGGSAAVELQEFITSADGADVLSDITGERTFTDIGGGVVELRSWFIFLAAPPAELENATAVLRFTLVDPTDASRQTEITRTLLLRF